jgi:hypothetical protein
MKDILMEQGETQFEPFTSLMQLNEEFGHRNVIHALTQLLAVEVEEDRCCVTCHRKALWWHGMLSVLLEQYEKGSLSR